MTKKYVVTSAQNNTELNKPFLKSLKNYCEFHGANLVVIPIRYKNPTSKLDPQEKDAESYDYWWPQEVEEYLLDTHAVVNNNLHLRGDVKIQATSPNPLGSMSSITGPRSAIFGHSQVSLECVPTPKNQLPNIMISTGSISEKNYSKTKLGSIAAFHHTHAAALVEVQNNRVFHIRQLMADKKGGFYDLDGYYGPRKSQMAFGRRAAGLVMGDSHVYQIDDKVVAATFDNANSIMNTLKPRELVWHDVLDFYTGSHHHEGRDYVEFRKALLKLDNVKEELEKTARFVSDHTPPNTTSLIVPSNHDSHLDQWLQRPLKNITNASIYHLLNHLVYEEISNTGNIPDAFQLYMKKFHPNDRVKFIDAGNGHLIVDIEVGQHGNFGAGGARGNIQVFAKSSYKHVIGHSHRSGIHKGTSQVGTSTGPLEYMRGLQASMNTHCVIYPNGKRSLIHIIDGDWRC